jgi:Rha family phage regulatory protein
MNNLTLIRKNGVLYTDSREVAKMVEKDHAHLMRDIKGYIDIISTNPELDSLDFFISNTYQDAKGETRPCYDITRRGCDMIANKMTGEKGVLFTATYVTAFEEMQRQLQTQFLVPRNFAEALRIAADQWEQNELLKLQNVQQQKEIDHKQDVIIGLVDQIDLAGKRQVLNRVVRYKGANYVERWGELYQQFEMKYHIDLSRRLESYNAINKPKLKNKLDYIDKILNKIPELYEIACKLYENDVKELVNQLYGLN